MNFMTFRPELSPSMQERSFASLDPQQGFYYLIECGGTLVGLVNLKNVDRESGTGEGGIFIADERFQNSMVAFQAILTIYDFGFDVLGLREITAHILDDNRRAIRFNEALGFKKDPGQEGVINPLWRLTLSEYRTRTMSIRSYFKNHNMLQK